jgi:ElaB/YqjD/DUF883 family membrane-anchored ribosome-binding protein
MTDLIELFTSSRRRVARDAETLSASARETAAAARQRVGEGYSAARDRAETLYEQGVDAAQPALVAGKRAAAQARSTIDRAAFQSRELIAERPLAALAIGVVAGVALGYLANRLASGASTPSAPDDDEDDLLTDYAD